MNCVMITGHPEPGIFALKLDSRGEKQDLFTPLPMKAPTFDLARS
jgi:hypothetical protein